MFPTQSYRRGLLALPLVALTVPAVGDTLPDHVPGQASGPGVAGSITGYGGSFRVQCPSHTALHPGTTDANGHLIPDPGIKCQEISGGDGYATMADGQQIYLFSFGPLSGLDLIRQGLPGTQKASDFFQAFNNPVYPGVADSSGSPVTDPLYQDPAIPGNPPVNANGPLTEPAAIMNHGVLAGSAPGPLMAIDEDDEFFLTLSNVGMIMRPDLFEQHTVHFHGYPNAAPIFDGVPDDSIATNIGGSMTYYYTAPDAGTYFWHCHITPPEHIQMGMEGQLYVRPRQNRVPVDGQTTLWSAAQQHQCAPSDFLCTVPLPPADSGALRSGSAIQTVSAAAVPAPGTGSIVTITTASQLNQIAPGTSVTVSGIVDGNGKMIPGYNGTYKVASVDPSQNTLTYTVPTLVNYLGSATGGTVAVGNYAYNDGNGSTYYDVEYPIQMMGFDPNFHYVGMTFNPEDFSGMKDKYFLLSGRSYPDTVTAGAQSTESSDGLSRPSQPLPTLISIHQSQGQTKALLRISELSVTEFHTLATIGIPMQVVGVDSRLLRDMDGNDLAYTTNSITLGGGMAADVILDASNVPKGTYFLYSTNLDHLSNDAENFGGMMTEIVVD